MERQSSAASSTEDTSNAQQDLSGGSRRDDGQPDFGVFKDFDFLEYESESIEGESTDNFNWGVRRRPLSDGDSEAIAGSKGHSTLEESLSEKTPILNKRKVNIRILRNTSSPISSIFLEKWFNFELYLFIHTMLHTT